MVKRIDNVVYATILAGQQGKLSGGYVEQGLAENAVGYAENYYNEHYLANIRVFLEESREFIINKKIMPPHTL
jgi:basic membrane lipoprotein Med (substrate-binding protein (PBP1-ABC) superfamily)